MAEKTAAPKGMRAKSIGHYILGKTIGEGTFGKVKLGTHILTGEKVAVKILEKERIVDVADVERVAREIHILKLVQHPHVIQLYEIIETPRQLYLIMEYCSGGELFDHIVASGRVREKEACRFFHQIIAGVEQIHRMSVVHRDLKPENLLLDDQRNIKIVDFGLSNTFQEGQLLKTACGSPCYAAPEMIAGQRYVPSRCDIWSCGVILFALVCGYLPFEDQNTAALYRKILNADYQAPKNISDSVRDMIARMLTTDPEQRTTIPRIRNHAWYRQIPESSHRWEGERGERVLEEDVLEQLDRFGFPRDYAVKCLQMCKHNHVTTTYYLLLEKKRRASMKDLAAGGLPNVQQGQAEEMEVVAECGTRDPSPIQVMPEYSTRDATPVQGEAAPHEPAPTVPKLSLDATGPQPGAAADADRAAGALPPEGRGAIAAPPKASSPEQSSGSVTPNLTPNYGQWAQAFGLPPPAASAVPAAPASPASARAESTAAGREPAGLRGDSGRRTATSAEPPSTGQQYHHHHAGAAVPLSARAPGGPRRHSDHHSAAVRGHPPGVSGTVGTGATSSQPTPRRRSPVQAGSYSTPRGSAHTPPQSAAASRAGGRLEPSGGTPSGYRSRTPGKRPGAGEALSARDAGAAPRPGTSQSLAAPARPAGPATARTQHANEARRRHYTASSDGAPGSARGPRPGSGGLVGSVAAGAGGTAAAAAAAVAADLYGNAPGGGGGGGGPPSARGTAGPSAAWAPGRPAPVPAGSGGGARASSASPELCVGGSVSAAYDAVPGGGPPLSAREARDEAMRTCRGAFNVSCTSSKAPKQIMQEMLRALALHRVACKQASAFLVRCQKQSLRFEMEISHLDHLESIYVVRFRRAAGEMAAYKELCSKILADMKI